MVSNIAKKDLFKLEDHPFFVEVDKNYVPLVEKINAQLGVLKRLSRNEMSQRKSTSHHMKIIGF